MLAVLEVDGLSIGYRSGKRGLNQVVADVSFALEEGAVLGLAGESGCGKSTLARAAIGWLGGNGVRTGGTVRFQGEDLLAKSRGELRRLWGSQLSYVPQEVSSALNPSRRVRAQLDEPLHLHTDIGSPERKSRVEELLEKVRIDARPETLARYPFEFSGGQQQRLALVLAMLCGPRVLVLDEPTTGIDASLRLEVFRALRELLEGSRTAVIYISHDLTETAAVADALAIMYAGEIVEHGPAQLVFERPRHPYAAALRAAVPTVRDARMVEGIGGRPPVGIVEDRCAFADRCEHADQRCLSGPVGLVTIGEHHDVRCLRVNELALGVVEHRGEALRRDGPPGRPPLLDVADVSCEYRIGGLAKQAVRHVSLALEEGETLGIVGESGSGKSTLLRAIAGLHPPSAGTIAFAAEPLAPRAQKRRHEQQRAVQLIFQNPERALNPRQTVAQILASPLRLYQPELVPAERQRALLELLDRAQLPAAMLRRYPHQLSGGEKQRVALARAFAARPRLLLCDEVVSALDVSVQATVMNLIRSYTDDTGAAALFVTHDLAVVRMMSDRVLVLRDGETCELAPTRAIFERPQHPYTVQLLASLPEKG